MCHTGINDIFDFPPFYNFFCKSQHIICKVIATKTRYAKEQISTCLTFLVPATRPSSVVLTICAFTVLFLIQSVLCLYILTFVICCACLPGREICNIQSAQLKSLLDNFSAFWVVMNEWQVIPYIDSSIKTVSVRTDF